MTPTPLPKKELLVLCCIMLSESVSITMLFPFVGFMVEDFGIASSTKEVGYYAGLIASTFNIAQFISSFWWGTLSDKYGRRPILLTGLFGNTLAIILFGYSTNLGWAILFRALNGLLNGNVGVAKTYVREITDSTNEAKGFSLISLTWGLGSIIGPTLGGVLTRPVQAFPSVFSEGSHFDDFPYILPCFASATFSLFGLITGSFFLKETLKKKNIEKKSLLKDDDIELTEKVANEEDQEANEGNEEQTLEIPQETPKRSHKEILRSLFKDKIVMSVVLLYGSLSIIFIILDEVFSFWVIIPVKEGGLGFTTQETGVFLGINGFCLIIFQFFIYHRLNAKFGVLNLYSMAMFLAAATISSVPLVGLLANPDNQERFYWKVWLPLIPIALAKASSSGSLFSSIAVMVSNSATSETIGATNGLAQSSASAFRAVGPALGGAIFAWSNTNGHGFPFNHWFLFLLLGIACIISGLAVLKIPKEVSRRRDMYKGGEKEEVQFTVLEVE